jgi:chemotaxis protein MotB
MADDQNTEENSNEIHIIECPAWLLTFADLISLLITFFVLLYSMKVVDTQKWEEMKGSFAGVFSIREPVVTTPPDQQTAIEKIDPFEADNLDYIEGILMQSFSQDPLLKDTTMSRDREKDRLIVSVPSSLVFESNEDALLQEGLRAVQNLGDTLRHLDNRIAVAGHTDPFPIKSDKFPSNWELGMARSAQIADVILSRGVRGPIRIISFADSRFGQIDRGLPISKRYAISRRVEVIIYGEKDSELPF